jgi:hypothetical protein
VLALKEAPVVAAVIVIARLPASRPPANVPEPVFEAAIVSVPPEMADATKSVSALITAYKSAVVLLPPVMSTVAVNVLLVAL